MFEISNLNYICNDTKVVHLYLHLEIMISNTLNDLTIVLESHLYQNCTLLCLTMNALIMSLPNSDSFGAYNIGQNHFDFVILVRFEMDCRP